MLSVVYALRNALGRVPGPSASSFSTPSKPIDCTEYDVDSRTGFMTFVPPLTRLDPDYEQWEHALDLVNCGTDTVLSLGEDTSPEALEKRDSSARWRQAIQKMPILSTEPLRADVRHQRRAHLVLAYLAHFYIHSAPPSDLPVIPASLAVPLTAVSMALGMAPILTYADTVLWNVVPADDSRPLEPGNLRVLTTFSGTEDEEAFYQCCATVELIGVDALNLMLKYDQFIKHVDPADWYNPDRLANIASGLEDLCLNIQDLTSILQAVYGTCAPRVFYDQIRPWFRGSSSGSVPWVYEGVNSAIWDDEWRSLAGPSGGQSTTMHAFDVFLDVDHAMEKDGDVFTTRTSVPTRPGVDRTFMKRMLKYMPGPHRKFLHQLADVPISIRQLSLSPQRGSSEGAVRISVAYNEAVLALRRFRDAHLKVACIYVVAQARHRAETECPAPKPQHIAPTPASAAPCPVGAMMMQLAEEGDADLLAVCPSSGHSLSPNPSPPKSKAEPVRGTGGTELVSLLRSCRDATSRAIIPRNL